MRPNPSFILEDERINSHDMIQEYFTEKSEKSKTTKFWVCVLLNSFILAFQFIRSEREGKLAYQFRCFWLYISSTSIDFYTEDGLYYLKSKILLENVQDYLL